jgi:hypothetical protein
MNRIVLLICLFLTFWEAPSVQASQDQVSNVTGLLKSIPSCIVSQAGKVLCVVVLPVRMATKTNKAGDHIVLGIHRIPEIARLEATIVEVQTGVRAPSILRIQISKAAAVNGPELPVEARIVAIVSPSKVREGWEFASIVVDRFPSSPEDEQRQPGERTLSADPPHVSPVDSLWSLLAPNAVVCPEKMKQPSPNACIDLHEVRGSFGFHAVQLDAGSTPAESILSSKKEMSFRAGTVLVLELNSTSRTP